MSLYMTQADQLSDSHATILQHRVSQIELKRPCRIQRSNIDCDLALVKLLNGRGLYDLFDLCFEFITTFNLHKLIEVVEEDRADLFHVVEYI